jgi:membrane protein
LEDVRIAVAKFADLCQTDAAHAVPGGVFMGILKRIIGPLWAAYGRFSEQEGSTLAAAIAYYLAFSLFPMMLVLVAILGWAFRFTAKGQNAQQYILTAVSDQASPALSEQLSRALNSVESHAARSGAVGIIVLLVTAIAIFVQLDYAFDRLWENPLEEKVTWVQRIIDHVFKRLKALGMLIAVGAFVIAVMISSLVWKAVQENATSILQLAPWVNRLLQPVIHLLLNLLAFTAMYRFLPKTAVKWRSAFVGGLIASALWEVGRQVLAAYVVADKLPSAYGLIGSFMAVMLWTYYAMLVVLYGAALTKVMDKPPVPAT